MAARPTTAQTEAHDGLDPLSLAVAPLYTRLDVHGEMLQRIIQILTEEKESDGPGLYKLLADLIARIEGQNRYLKDLTVAVAKLGINLPLDLVRAIDDNLDLARRDEGHPNGATRS